MGAKPALHLGYCADEAIPPEEQALVTENRLGLFHKDFLPSPCQSPMDFFP